MAGVEMDVVCLFFFCTNVLLECNGCTQLGVQMVFEGEVRKLSGRDRKSVV